jgi:DNA-binding transcriptional LysR family regulator
MTAAGRLYYEQSSQALRTIEDLIAHDTHPELS